MKPKSKTVAYATLMAFRDLIKRFTPGTKGLISYAAHDQVAPAARFTELDPLTKSSSFWNGYGSAQPPGYTQFLRAHKTNVWVGRAVNIYSTTLASVPFKWFLEDSTGDRVEVLNGPAQLLAQPNPWQSSNVLRTLTHMDLALNGNAFWEIIPDSKKIPRVIIRLRPDRVTVVQDKDGFIEGYKHWVNGKKRVIPHELVVHFIIPDPTNEFYGAGPMETAWGPYERDTAANNFNLEFYRKGAKPSGIISIDRNLGDREFKSLQSRLIAMHSGVKNASRWLLLESGMKAEPWSQSFKDMDFKEMRKMSREEIIAMFGIPPSLMGLFEFANYANVKEQIRIYWEYTAFPALISFESQLNTDLAPLYEPLIPEKQKLITEMDISGINALHEDKDSVAARSVSLKQARIINLNEARILNGYEPVEDGDVFDTDLSDLLFENISEAEKALLLANDVRLLPPPTKAFKKMSMKRISPARRAVELNSLLNPYSVDAGKSYERYIDDNDLITELRSRVFIRENKTDINDADRDWLRVNSAGFDYFDDMNEDLEDLGDIEVNTYEAGARSATRRIVAADKSAKHYRKAFEFELTSPEILNQLANRELFVKEALRRTLFDDYQEIFLKNFFELHRDRGDEALLEAVGKAFNTESRWKALQIAVTESAGIVAQSDRDVYDQNGIEEHEWAHSGNPNGREFHRDTLDGTQKNIAAGELFNVNGTLAKGPHAAGLPASEVVSCECTSEPVVKVLPEQLWRGN